MAAAEPSFVQHNVPAVISWSPDNDSSDGKKYLGYTYGVPPCPVTFDMHVDLAHNLGFFKLCIPVGMKGRKGKTSVFLFIPPEHVASLDVVPTSEIPEPFLQTLSRSEDASMALDAIGLRFALGKPPAVIVPRGTGIHPKTDSYAKILADLQSLAQAASFVVYVSGKAMPKARVDEARTRPLRSLPGEDRVDRLYDGKGGKDIGWENLCLRAGEEPPSYRQVGPPPPTTQKTRGKKRKKRDASSSSDGEDHASLAASIAQLKALHERDVAALRAEAREREQRFEQRLAEVQQQRRKELRQELHDEMQEEFRTELSRELEDLKKQIMEDIDKRLDEREELLRGEIQEEIGDVRDDCLDDAGEIVDWKIDEQLTGIKDELQTFVDEELKNVEDRIKDDICSSSLSLNFN